MCEVIDHAFRGKIAGIGGIGKKLPISICIPGNPYLYSDRISIYHIIQAIDDFGFLVTGLSEQAHLVGSAPDLNKIPIDLT